MFATCVHICMLCMCFVFFFFIVFFPLSECVRAQCEDGNAEYALGAMPHTKSTMFLFHFVVVCFCKEI